MIKNSKLICKCFSFMLGTVLLYGCASVQPSDMGRVNEHDDSIKVEKEVDSSYSISFFGDLLIHNTVYNAAKAGDTYDFTNHFIDIKDKLLESDFRVANLEVPTAGKELGYSNYPAFNCPEQILDALKSTLNIDLVTNATNHALDKGYKGLVNTIDFLDKAGIPHIGTYKDKESSDKLFIKELDNGIKIAFLNYTYGTNGIAVPKDHPYAVNIINKDKIKKDSDKAKEFGADFIIAKVHWGTEYQQNESGYGKDLSILDSSSQRGLAKYLFENTDINLIVGDHPHVVQNIEQMSVTKNNSEKKGVVIYSLGNFISDQRDILKNSGIIAKVNLYINKTYPEKTKVESIEYTPVYVDRNPRSNIKKYRVVDVNKAIYDYENGLDDLILKKEYDDMVYTRDYYRGKLLHEEFVVEN